MHHISIMGHQKFISTYSTCFSWLQCKLLDYYFIICHHTYCSAVLLWKFDVNWLSMCTHGRPEIGSNILQVIGTTALVLSQDGISKNFLGGASPRLPYSLPRLWIDMCTLDTIVTPALIILQAWSMCSMYLNIVDFLANVPKTTNKQTNKQKTEQNKWDKRQNKTNKSQQKIHHIHEQWIRHSLFNQYSYSTLPHCNLRCLYQLLYQWDIQLYQDGLLCQQPYAGESSDGEEDTQN